MNMYVRLKKDTKWSILKLGSFKTSNIKKELIKYKDEWELDTSRQENNAVHSPTKQYKLLFTSYYWEQGDEINPELINTLKTKKAIEELEIIFKQIENYYNGIIVRSEIIKMLPNSKIFKHVDGGTLLHYGRRCHIPIVTHPDITFTVFNNSLHMEESGWYEINNTLPHSVSNPTDIERIHLIVDVLPKDMIK